MMLTKLSICVLFYPGGYKMLFILLLIYKIIAKYYNSFFGVIFSPHYAKP